MHRVDVYRFILVWYYFPSELKWQISPVCGPYRNSCIHLRVVASVPTERRLFILCYVHFISLSFWFPVGVGNNLANATRWIHNEPSWENVTTISQTIGSFEKTSGRYSEHRFPGFQIEENPSYWPPTAMWGLWTLFPVKTLIVCPPRCSKGTSIPSQWWNKAFLNPLWQNTSACTRRSFGTGCACESTFMAVRVVLCLGFFCGV